MKLFQFEFIVGWLSGQNWIEQTVKSFYLTEPIVLSANSKAKLFWWSFLIEKSGHKCKADIL